MENCQDSKYLISELNGPCAQFSKRFSIQRSAFLIDERYQIQETLGRGAFALLVLARDAKTEKLVAIRKIEGVFNNLFSAKRVLRELKIMRLLKHENIVELKSIQLPLSREELSDIYMILEPMETDLKHIIKSPQPLSDDHCKYLLYQILRGLKYIHSAGILHMDLKPENLLVNSNCDLKICDFGIAYPVIRDATDITLMRDYVDTHWYRAPELLLSYKKCTSAIDIWSTGCILGELLLRKPIFLAYDRINQVEIICNLIGSPSAEEIQKIRNAFSRELVSRWQERPENLSCLFKDVNPLALDLLKKMLVFDPDKRITAEQALCHPYLEELHFVGDEPEAVPVSSIEFEHEERDLTEREYKDLVYEEILLYHFKEKKNARGEKENKDLR